MRFWLVLIIASSVFINNAGASVDFNHKITKMIKTNLPDASVGMLIQDATTGKILYDYHGNRHLLPASTAKLFTAAAALKHLGIEYRYQTSFYYHRGGDAAIKFTGDPSFKLADLRSLLKQLQQAKIKLIYGDLWIDDTAFSGPMLAPGWGWNDMPWYHAAPVSAIIIDQNQFGITLLPANKIGGLAAIKLNANPQDFKPRNLTGEVRGVTLEDSEHLCQVIIDVDEQNNVALGGCWPIGDKPINLRLAVKNPRLQAQQLLLAELNKLNIRVNGKIKFGKTPANLPKVATHVSEPLPVLLNAILGDSNNLYAESLVKTLGAELFGTGSFQTGTLAVQQILAPSTGIDFTQLRLVDGSGASRYNLLSPLHLSKLLYVMHHDPKLSAPFRAALPFKRSIQAKTGTLTGVSALSGYITTRSKRELIVTIMINHALGSSASLKQFEDDVCNFLMVNM